MSDENKTLTCLGIFVAAIVGVVLASITQGWALSVMWGWFVTPLFGVAAPSIPLAIGFSMVVGMLVRTGSTKSDDTSFWMTLAVQVLYPFLILGIGAIVRMFL